MNKDQVKGRIKEVQGKITEVAGRIVGNDRMKVKGQVEQAAGKAQSGLGALKDSIDVKS